MWYVVQVMVGTEDNIRIQCEKTIGADIMERCFIPYAENIRKLAGEYRILQKPLFPGYLFMVSDNAVKLFYELKHVIGFSNLLRCEEDILSLTPEEVKFLLRLGGEEQFVEMSEGVIRDGKIWIYKGPLMGLEEKIVKIDRHKRKAWIVARVGGEEKTVGVGLEIVEKS